MEDLIAGYSFAQTAYRYKTVKHTIENLMKSYRPFRTWINERKQHRTLLEDEVRSYLLSGKPLSFCAELYDMDYSDMRQFVRDMEYMDGRRYLGEADSIEARKLITVQDVARFKVSVNVGELLCCDETEDGIMIYCKILKKHMWYADTDMGCIDWNWLAVRNERRVFGNEAIYG